MIYSLPSIGHAGPTIRQIEPTMGTTLVAFWNSEEPKTDYMEYKFRRRQRSKEFSHC